MGKLVSRLAMVVAAIVAVTLVGAPRASAAPISVDLELSLLVDISDSISSDEFDLQMAGYEQAFRDSYVIARIKGGTIGAIAVNLVMWSGEAQQYEVVGWTLINDAASANAFADAIAATVRPANYWTAIDDALNFAVPLFDSNNFAGSAQIIDISGDGQTNDGDEDFEDVTSAARDAALAAGIDQINGLVINRPDQPGLYTWYQDNVIAGTGSFAMQVDSFDDFDDAIRAKIISELVPVPSSLLLALLGATGGLAMLRRKSS